MPAFSTPANICPIPTVVVTVREGEEEVARAVMLDEGAGEGDQVEVLTGLRPGDVVVTP